ncbi:cupin domain-containing protein [Maribrevibacterium harenarium]|uniref:Cupin domain-containing protein n=1 Tax=Maribrevibacterium harenarium TaxID=2589817 RepID=A0A501X0L4_9GAMM|nr:cupin domain-containing protein [Maribrevibacterium harenarium]TPE53331.1 cupin domain-containing protein [Maribrevibacterium harenarium]
MATVVNLDNSVEATNQQQAVYDKEKMPSFVGPEEMFSGQVDVKLTFPNQDAVPFSGAFVTFQPKARTAWHDHPGGQHIVVTKGVAITATRDGQVVACQEGDAVWCPADVDHWHGAMPEAEMTHFVITGVKDGDAVNWKDKVTDEQYDAAVAAIKAAQ